MLKHNLNRRTISKNVFIEKIFTYKNIFLEFFKIFICVKNLKVRDHEMENLGGKRRMCIIGG